MMAIQLVLSPTDLIARPLSRGRANAMHMPCCSAASTRIVTAGCPVCVEANPQIRSHANGQPARLDLEGVGHE